MNFRIQVDSPAIFTTGAAVDGSTVFGSLEMARAALDDSINAEIKAAAEDCHEGIIVLQLACRERVLDLRAARKAALRVREADLARDDDIGNAGILASGPTQEAPSAASHTPAPDPAPAGGADTAGAITGTIISLALASGDPGPPGNGWKTVSGETTAGGGEDAISEATTDVADLLAVPAFLRRARP